jgi:hypothetical protein
MSCPSDGKTWSDVEIVMPPNVIDTSAMPVNVILNAPGTVAVDEIERTGTLMRVASAASMHDVEAPESSVIDTDVPATVPGMRSAVRCVVAATGDRVGTGLQRGGVEGTYVEGYFNEISRALYFVQSRHVCTLSSQRMQPFGRAFGSAGREHALR